MRNFLATPFIVFALVIGATGAAPVAHAETSTTITAQTAQAAYQECQKNGGTGVQCQAAYDAYAAAANTSTNPADAANAAKISTDYQPDKNDSIFNSIMQKIMSLFAWLVGAAAIILDNAVYYTVVRMGEYVGSLSAVGVTWRILRDVGNIMLIFGFLAIGITTTILNVNWYGGGKKMIPMLLVAAVFLNFSLFISEAIVDAGNLFATEFYKEINGGQIAGAKNFDIAAATNDGIANKIMGRLGLQGIYGSAIKNTNVLEGSNPLFIGFMGVILFLVTAFVMFSLAFILIARFVALLFLIIVAPVGFAGLAVPQLKTLAGQWWGKLFEQTITAPVLLLMLYIALRVITDEQFLTGFVGNSSDSALAWTGFVGNTNLPGFAGVLLSFLVAMGLLLAVVVFAKNLSAFGAGWATNWGGRLSFGVTGWAARNTVGLGSNFLAKQARKRGISRIPVLGTNITRALEYGAKSSFDVRGAKVGGGLKAIGIDAGKAQEGGYKAELKERVEARTKYAGELKGKEFKDLQPEQQLEMIRQENDITRLKKQIADGGKAGTLTPDKLKYLNEAVERSENELDTMHKKAGTERGAKLTYGARLGKLAIPYIGFPTSNVEAAKKIKEEARKSKDDKDLDTLRKALKKAGGEEDREAPPTTPPPASGTPSSTSPGQHP